MKKYERNISKLLFLMFLLFITTTVTMFVSYRKYTNACVHEKEAESANLNYWDGTNVSPPVDNGFVTSDFNTVDLFHPRPHNGTDFASSGNVYAVVDGIVVSNDYNESRGHHIAIAFKKENNVYYTYLYQHLKYSSIKRIGELVKSGEKVAEVGSSGYAFGVHLHAEVEYAKNINGNIQWVGTYPTNSNVMFDFLTFFHLPRQYVNGNRTSQQQEINCQTQKSYIKDFDNVEKAWYFFRQKGFTEEASAGIIGNLIVESNMEPTVKEVGALGGGRGIAQWGTCGLSSTGVSGGCRWLSLVKWAKHQNMNPDELLTQLEYIVKEMNDENIMQYFKESKILYLPNQGIYGGGTVGYFAEKFERPDRYLAKMEQRFLHAKKILLKYGRGEA